MPVVAKRFGLGSGTNGELRLEVFNIFNHTQLRRVSAARCRTRLPTEPAHDRSEQGPARPAIHVERRGDGTFGKATSTVGTTVGIGTNRQIQLAFRLNF